MAIGIFGTWEQKENKTGNKHTKIEEILLGNTGTQGKFCWEQGNMNPLPPGRPSLIRPAPCKAALIYFLPLPALYWPSLWRVRRYTNRRASVLIRYKSWFVTQGLTFNYLRETRFIKMNFEEWKNIIIRNNGEKAIGSHICSFDS